MKLLTTIFVLLSVSGFAQSKKAINEQLQKELAEQKFIYENTMNVHRQTLVEIEKQREYVNEIIDTDLNILQRQCTESLSSSKESIRILTKLGIPVVDTLANVEKQIRGISSSLNTLRELHTIQMGRDFFIDSVGIQTPWTDKKIKEQNVLLLQNIDSFKAVNEKNRVTLDSEKECLRELRELQLGVSEIIARQWSMKSQLGNLESKLDGKLRDEKIRYVTAKDRKAFSKAYEEELSEYLIPEHVVAFEVPEFEDEPEIESESEEYNVESVSDNPEPDMSYVNLEEKEKHEPEIYDWVDEPAEFPGGQEAFRKYLSDHLRYPSDAREAMIQGKVYVKFVVSDKGVVSNPNVVKGINGCESCSVEAKRLILSLPTMIPGKIKGKAVNSYFIYPVQFKLQ